MTEIRYSPADIAELTTLADEARALDAEWRAVMAEISTIISEVVGETYIGWEIDYSDTMSDVIAAMRRDFRAAPVAFLPTVDQYARGKTIQRAAEWGRLNNRCRREIAKARKAVAAYR